MRRIFDWENKYINTVLDIKSRALKDALKDVMEEVKGVSFAEETPVIDPNMIFLYLEEIRTHMKKLKKKSKTETKKEKKNKKKFSATTKSQHLKVLIKYLDKDYSEIKKTLYPLLENNIITFDLLWALFKSNEIAYCPTYGNPDEPRAFKIEYANLVTFPHCIGCGSMLTVIQALFLRKRQVLQRGRTLSGVRWQEFRHGFDGD